jgi:superfamily II RNA helicase
MVKICSYNYPKDTEEEYKQYYDKYSYDLHDFQKWSIEAIVTGNHVLVCCPTGSGKTFSGEFALEYFHSKGKKTIYTTPIKALSNEKFYSFTKKYPHISIGLITGDIKTNPDADVLIMTTEILLNKLYQIKSTNKTVSKSSVSFEMNIETDLGCVVYDEIHFINDESRGHTWEQTIMMLPPHIQMVGLSATLDTPEKFALWLETRGTNEKIGDKEVFLARKMVRAVPLIHYSFITATTSVDKYIKDKALKEEINKAINKPFVIQNEKGVFNDVQYQSTSKILGILEKYDIRVKRQHVLNKVAEYLVEHEMLPALCYVFSRKQLERCAEELTTNILEFDSKVPYIVDRECEQIIRKLPNYEEYLRLPEYVNTVKLLRKGVGIHHAGLLPVLREITELLFSRGFIKILFCTETMSVGINLPVKTTIFTDVNKFNGETIRMLHGHEYTQAAGRAGRLGLDKVGHVIHLNNLFRDIVSVNYKAMMNGKPQTLISKFKISYNLLLNLIDIGETDYTKFAKRSMIQNDIDNEMKEYNEKQGKMQKELDNMTLVLNTCRTPFEVVEEYIELNEKRLQSVNKKRKDAERAMQQIANQYHSVEKDIDIVLKYNAKKSELNAINGDILKADNFLNCNVTKILDMLNTMDYISLNEITNYYALTVKGTFASHIREVHCLVFAELIHSNKLKQFGSKELVGILSCFTNISVPDEKRAEYPCSDYTEVKNCIAEIYNEYQKQSNNELVNSFNTGIDYSMHFDLINYSMNWCECTSDEDCKILLQDMALEKDVFLGEFVKAILKINNIATEMEKIAELMGDMEFLSILKEIPLLTLKYVVTNQSLYI